MCLLFTFVLLYFGSTLLIATRPAVVPYRSTTLKNFADQQTSLIASHLIRGRHLLVHQRNKSWIPFPEAVTTGNFLLLFAVEEISQRQSVPSRTNRSAPTIYCRVKKLPIRGILCSVEGLDGLTCLMNTGSWLSFIYYVTTITAILDCTWHSGWLTHHGP